MAKQSLLERFNSHVTDGTNTYNGSLCRHWTGGLTGGYGSFHNGVRTVRAHRWAYEQRVGPFPITCISTTCATTLTPIAKVARRAYIVDTSTHLHMQAIVLKTNVRRGKSASAVNATKTHCVNGHEFTPDNTYWRNTERGCNICRLARVRSDRQLERADRGESRGRQELITVTRTCSGAAGSRRGVRLGL
jgi:hypothetical protein